MEVLDRSKFIPLSIGDANKILKVKGNTGTKTPIHACTHEATIMVQEGEALLQMPDARWREALESGRLIRNSGKEGTRTKNHQKF